jgi:acetyl esterase/lipase
MIGMVKIKKHGGGMSIRSNAFWSLTLAWFPLLVPAQASFDAAKAFGARESVADMSLSPDGLNVAYVAPVAGQGSVVYVQSLAKGAPLPTRPALTASGKPERIDHCSWVSNQRLACLIYGVVASGTYDTVPFSRMFAVNTDGSNLKMLSTENNEHTQGVQTGGGHIIDRLPDEEGAVLMTRVYIPDEHLGSRAGSSKSGLGVDWIDTQTLATRIVEQPRDDAVDYISDGRGTIRIMGLKSKRGALDDYDSGNIVYRYRLQGSREWRPFGDGAGDGQKGFAPVAVDHDRNVAYGFKKLDGRQALYAVALDGSLKEELIYSRPDVDVDRLIQIGRRGRVVGVSYSDDYAHSHFLDPDFERLAKSLAKALPGGAELTVVDSNIDESKLLIRADSDHDPGVYYLFDRKLRQLDTFLVVRAELEGVKLASVKPVSYPAADGTLIPGYLTLPPGVETPKNLPAIVMPHGGPDFRDMWGFDWLTQFYAARGFAVLQPNYRGSTGFGDEWTKQNAYHSWSIAIGDVLDAGKWLVAQGIANPSRLAIVGWSFGGYAALQSAVVDPSVFKAVIAIAPVTDLPQFKEDRRRWKDFLVLSREIGEGPQVREGSPALNAGKIKVPVLLFHGELDRNVLIRQSREMNDHLASAGVPHELITWPELDHQLEDSAARAEMLNKSDAFLRKAMGM